jgi:hypothetical protein
MKNNKLPGGFDYISIVEMTCKEYAIRPEEFFSSFRYGNLPCARQSVCYILKQMKISTGEIGQWTGFSRWYIANAMKHINGDEGNRMHCENILKKVTVCK